MSDHDRTRMVALNSAYATSPELLALIEKAKGHVMSAEERRAQRRSWVIGQFGMTHPEMSREEVEASVDRNLPELAPAIAGGGGTP